ncbi:MAG: hypothetical protein WKF91_01270 [Segetibacter sp.]|jgi:hypothetical protein
MNYNVPYSFILSFFFPVRPVIKKMLGCYGLFVNKKLVVLLRERDNQPEFNGVFIATQPEYFDELSNELHSSNMDFDIDGAEYTWIFISEDLEDFKDKVKKAAELIKNGDQRIGK